MMDHIASTADQPQKQFIVGTVSNVRFKAPHLVGDICILGRREAIRVIESGEKQRNIGWLQICCGHDARHLT